MMKVPYLKNVVDLVKFPVFVMLDLDFQGCLYNQRRSKEQAPKRLSAIKPIILHGPSDNAQGDWLHWKFWHHDRYLEGMRRVVVLLMVQKSGSPVEVGSLSRYLMGFIHPRWCRISSIVKCHSIFLGRGSNLILDTKIYGHFEGLSPVHEVLVFYVICYMTVDGKWAASWPCGVFM